MFERVSRCEHSSLLPSAEEHCFLRADWEAPWPRVTGVTWILQWPGSSGWKILFPVSSPCFLLNVSPLAVTISSQPPTCSVVFHYHQNGDAKHNCPSIPLPQGLKACVLSVGKKWITWRKFTQLSYPYRKPNRTYTGNHFLSSNNDFNGLKITVWHLTPYCGL